MQEYRVSSINTKGDLKEFYEYMDKYPDKYELTKKLINIK